jgi:hypothetical protein
MLVFGKVRELIARKPTVDSGNRPHRAGQQAGHYLPLNALMWLLLSCRSPLAVQYSDDWFVHPLLASTVDEEANIYAILMSLSK